MGKNIYKGSWWYNKRRKHPAIIIRSNNKDYFEIRLLSHKKYDCNDFLLIISPNPDGDKRTQYINSRKYVEMNKKSFGINLTRYNLSVKDKRRFKKWKNKIKK